MEKTEKSKVDLTKLQFTRDVWEQVDMHQQEELQLAICGLSEEYELADLVAHLAVSAGKWFNMNRNERIDYVVKFNRLSVEDAMAGKTIAIATLPDTHQPEFNEFSVEITSILKSMKNWTDGLVDTIVQGAEALLNCKDAIQTMPSLTVASRKKFLVGAQNKKGMYECAVYSDHVTCACSCYKFNKLCKHSLCVAEKTGMIKDHLDFIRKTTRRNAPCKSALVKPTKDAQGKKGGSHRNPWRPSRANSTDARNQRPFTEVHHNNKPLVLCFLDGHPKAQEC